MFVCCVLAHFYPIVLLRDCFTVFWVCVSWWLCCAGVFQHVLTFHFWSIRLIMLCSWANWSSSILNLSSCLWSNGFWHLISYIVFCWYGGGLHMPLCPCYCASCLCYSYLMVSSIVVVCSMPNYVSHIHSPLSFLWSAKVSCRYKRNICMTIFMFI